MLPDCDVPGIAHGDKVCRALLSQGCEVYDVEADDFGYQIETKHGKDISDWLMLPHLVAVPRSRGY